MKEIIYLDTDLMNSMLAQLGEGLITSYSFEEANQESETEGQQSGKGKKAGISAQLRVSTGILGGGEARVGGNLDNDSSEITNESRTVLEGQKDILNKAFHDHALNILLENLISENLLSEGTNLKEGDLYLGESPYKFYDFDLLKNMVDSDKLSTLMLGGITEKEYNEAKKLAAKPIPKPQEKENWEEARRIVQTYEGTQPIIKILKQLELVSSFFAQSFRDVSITKMDDKLGILKKKYLREFSEGLLLRPDTSRKVKYLVRVIGKKGKVFDGLGKVDDIPLENFDTLPTIIFDILLGSFEMLKEGDILVTPVAIYFE